VAKPRRNFADRQPDSLPAKIDSENPHPDELYRPD